MSKSKQIKWPKDRQCTEVRFASFLSGGFTTIVVNESTGKETGKTHLCAVVRVEEES